ncbi:MAG: DUF1634 domain-containing protein [Betaproteobacteria bacterium]|nr:DUF1634 domain-containing protein [Betaproteobacteria bacterium]
MKPAADPFVRREQNIAALLWYGTWFASALIAAGILLTALGPLPGSPAFSLSGHDLVKAGVAVFIFLPIARVGLMLAIFARERDYVYSAIAALVLVIIASGVILEI